MLIYSARPALGFGKNMWLGINLLEHLSQWKSNILSFLNRCYDEYGRSKIQRDRLVDLHAWQNIPFFISLLNSISQARNETDFQRFFHCENNCILMERRCLHINRFRLTNRLAWNRNRAYMLPIWIKCTTKELRIELNKHRNLLHRNSQASVLTFFGEKNNCCASNGTCIKYVTFDCNHYRCGDRTCSWTIL